MCFKATLDIRELELRLAREQADGKDRTIRALEDLAEARRVTPIEVRTEVPSWIYPVGAFALVLAFAAGFRLGWDPHQSP